jgi:hypothetical protein
MVLGYACANAPTLTRDGPKNVAQRYGRYAQRYYGRYAHQLVKGPGCEMSEGTNPRLIGALLPDPAIRNAAPVSGPRSLLNNRVSVYARMRQKID